MVPVEQATQLKRIQRCQTLSKAGNPCGMPVMSADVPYCYLHLPQANLNGKRLERYNDSLPKELKGDFDKISGDINSKDLSEELATARTMLSHLLRQWEKTRNSKGNLDVTAEQLDMAMKCLHLIKTIAESQAKINPERVVTIEDMKNILLQVIDIIRSNIPAEMKVIRERIVYDINKYAMADLLSRALEIPFGSTIPTKKNPDEPAE